MNKPLDSCEKIGGKKYRSKKYFLWEKENNLLDNEDLIWIQFVGNLIKKDIFNDRVIKLFTDLLVHKVL